MSDTACPALSELLAEELSSDLAVHAAECLRCGALRRSIDIRVDMAASNTPRRRHTPVAGEPGVIALVAAGRADEFLPVVVLGVGEYALTVVPVSATPELATEWDLMLPVHALGYSSVAQVWNIGHVLPEQLEDIVGQLEPSAFEQLTALARAATTSTVAPVSAAVGAPVLTDRDPRLLAQDDQAERASVYWEPAVALSGAATLGELVRHRHDELDAELAAEPWLRALERDELDLPRAVPSQSLAELVRRLGLGASRRLREIARGTIEAQSPAVARGKTGLNTVAENERYLDEFMTALSDEP